MQKTKKSPVVVHKKAGRVRFITLNDVNDLKDLQAKVIEDSTVVVHKEAGKISFLTLEDLNDLQARVIEGSPIVVQPAVRKAGIRRNRNHKPLNPNRRKMTVNVEESFVEIQEMNDKALKILAKRA